MKKKRKEEKLSSCDFNTKQESLILPAKLFKCRQ